MHPTQFLITAVRFLGLGVGVISGSSVPVSQLVFQKGDLIAHGGMGAWLGRKINLPPHHKFLALSNHELFTSTLVREAADGGKKKWRSKLFIVDTLHLHEHEKRILVKKVKAKHATIGDTGIALARRMNKMRLYFHATRCNTNHYVDYVLYGKTFGQWWKPLYMPKHPKCPVHRVIKAGENLYTLRALQTKNGEIPLPH